METKEIFEYYDMFDENINLLRNKIDNLVQQRIDFTRENSKHIKKIFPIKNKIYEIIDINTFRTYGYDFTDEKYYFKVISNILDPIRQFNRYDCKYPIVKGDILDINLNKVYYSDREIYINNLKEITKENSPDKFINSFTYVYVLIDKNTRYYKIGRSKNPLKREKTLQSEKPTIEMIYSHDARIKDEKVLHDYFKSKRVRGEWFDLSGSDLQYIKEYFNKTN
jgi:hypothetical protein